MKPLAYFVVGLAVVFGLFALVTTLLRETDRVFVVVDSSFAMREVWTKVPVTLNEIDDERFSEYALATEKSFVHSWQEGLELGVVTPFAPCDFSDITSYSEVGEADELILITTATSCPNDALTEWRVIVLEP